jgi:hypothetical protein
LSNNTLFAYVDDIVIIGNTRQEVIIILNVLLRTANPIGREVNQDKAKYLVMIRGTRDNSDLVLRNYSFQPGVDLKWGEEDMAFSNS